MARIGFHAGHAQKQHHGWIERDRELGFDEIHLDHVGAEPERFVQACGDRVLSALPASPV